MSAELTLDLLIKNFLKYGSLSAAEREAIIESTEVKSYKKGDYLLKEGQWSSASFFVLEGCVRQFSLLNGEDLTTRFFVEGNWIISPEEISEQSVSIHNWVCMEDCHLVTGNEQKAKQLFHRFPGLETISRKIVEAAFADLQKSMLSRYAETPEQRYLSLVQSHPDILQRVPQYHIASYIGVKPESLSRIRKRLVKKPD